MRASYVYLIRYHGHIKIGVSSNPKLRLHDLSAGMPGPSELLRVYPGDRTVERKLHDLFAAKRVKREWFLLDDEDVDQIDAPLGSAATDDLEVAGPLQIKGMPPEMKLRIRIAAHEAGVSMSELIIGILTAKVPTQPGGK